MTTIPGLYKGIWHGKPWNTIWKNEKYEYKRRSNIRTKNDVQ